MRRTTSRLAVVTAVLVLTTAWLSGVAGAHTEVTAAPADGGRTTLTFAPEQECGNGTLPRVGLRVQLPTGATDVVPEPQAGWTAEVTATEVRWSSPTGAADPTFTVAMELSQPAGTTLYLPAIQQCPGGEEIAWIETPTQAGGEAEHPAPTVVVPANATAPATTATTAAPTTTAAASSVAAAPATSTDSGSNTALIVVIVIVVVLALGAVALLISRRRRQGQP